MQVKFPERDRITPVYGIDEARLVQSYRVSIYRGITSWYFLDVLGESEHFKVRTMPPHRTVQPFEADFSNPLRYFSRVIPPTYELLEEYGDYVMSVDSPVRIRLRNMFSEPFIQTVQDLYAPRVLLFNPKTRQFKLRYMESRRDKRYKSDYLVGIIGIKGRLNLDFKNAVSDMLHNGHATTLINFDTLDADILDALLSTYINRQLLAEVTSSRMAYELSTEIFALRLEYKESPEDNYKEYNPLYPPLVVDPSLPQDPVATYAAYLLARCEDINFKSNVMREKPELKEDFEL